MRFVIDPHTTDGLRVITEIPNIPTCMLEGQNGIGKTVAVQLLQLISGEIPEIFTTHPNLWASLRDRLNATSVQIDELQGDRRLKFTFSPGRWNDKPPDEVGEWLGAAMIDGEPAEVADCSRLLSVIRIAGDEDLEDTLRRRVDILTAQFGSAAGLVRVRGAAIERLLAGIVPDLKRTDPADIESDEALLRSNEDELEEAETGATAADKALRNLLRALETKRRLDAAGLAADALMSRRDELVSEVKGLETDLESKEADAGTAEDALSAGGDTQKKLADAERALRYRRKRVANLERETERLATALAVDASVDETASALEVVDAELAILQERHRQLDRTALVRSLIDEVTPPIKGAEADAADQLLVRMNEGGLTVSQTLHGMTLRRQELADHPQPSELRELAAQIDKLDERRRDLRDLGNKLQESSKWKERVQLAEQEAEEASQQAEQASEAAQLVRDTHQAIGAVQEALTKAHAELATVLQQISGIGATSREDAEHDLQAALEALDLEQDQLDEAEGAARQRLAEADNRVIELTNSVSTVRRRLTTRKTEVGLLIDRLLGDSRYKWLADTSPDLSARLVNVETRYDTFAQLRRALLDANEAAYQSAEFLENLVGIAEGFFTTVKPEPGREPDLRQDLKPAFEAVIGQRLRETLNRPAIRDAIFDGAEVVAVEAGTRQLSLQDSRGHISHRPMEAFSSGERAYAFTQARIADLEPSEKPNRLLVLDEFGAYVAADRLPDLADFLANEVQGVVADQVLVILPLHVDYGNELANTVGELRARYEERLEQIKQRGYCAVELT
jgi:hypothetical protein